MMRTHPTKVQGKREHKYTQPEGKNKNKQSTKIRSRPLLPRYIENSGYEPGYACIHVQNLVFFKYSSFWHKPVML
jgi:hypothetical protein